MATISRREILNSFLSGHTTSRQEATSSLEPYDEPLSLIQAYHLLRRTSFGASYEVARSFVGKRASEVVEQLLNNAEARKNPGPPGWVNITVKDPNRLSGNQKQTETDKMDKSNHAYNTELMEWWVNLMSKDTDSILEKMVLFWHGHFTSQYDICNRIFAQLMYRQNALFRQMHLGSFSEFLEKITLDGAMLLYLNGNENYKEAPNENYGRELMELFTMGIGHYTEDDVREAAKILTGWRIAVYEDQGVPYQPFFITQNFDTSTKTFMNEKFEVNYPVTKENVFKNSIQALISVILRKRSKEIAQFMSLKIYRALVYSNPEKADQAVISQMASTLISENFNFRPMVARLLKSKHFFDPQNIGIQIKSPAETIIGFCRNFTVPEKLQRELMSQMGMQLLSPPNVAGWKGYRGWVTTKTYPFAIKYLSDIINDLPNTTLATWAAKFGTFEDPHKLTSSLTSFFLGKTPGPSRDTRFTQILLAGAPDYEWYQLSKNSDTAGFKLKGLLKEIIKAPDFYLC